MKMGNVKDHLHEETANKAKVLLASLGIHRH